MTGSATPSIPPSAASVPEPLLSIRDLVVEFSTEDGVVQAVDGISYDLYPGETLGIVGESGSGKSVSTMSLLGLIPQPPGKVVRGEALYKGTDLLKISKKELRHIRGNEIALIFQDPMTSLNPVLKIGAQIDEAIRTHHPDEKDARIKERSIELLRTVGVPNPDRRYEQYPHEFSGGMRQRALIAIGLSCQPRLLIADEPTSALDVTVQRQILDHLDKMTTELGTAVLLITHDLGLAAERADKVVVMYRGQVVESGPSLELLRNPQHPYTQRLVSSAPSLASRRIQVAKEQGVESEDLLAPAEEGVVEAAKPDEVLKIENLRKVFKLRSGLGRSTDFTAVDDVSFSVKRGTTTAIVGESGSGKSTVAQMVLNLLQPTSGKIVFDGVDTSTLNAKEIFAFRRRVQPIFQDPYGSLDPMYNIFRTIEEPLRTHKIGTKASREKKVRELLDQVALPQSTMQRYPNELSGGQRQRVAIARALALDPEVIICDEAVSALDVLVQAQVLNLLADLQSRLGLTYLFITHDLAVVRQIADHVCVMEKGKLVETGSTDDVFDAPQKDYT
ncbi:MAG: ABC transporter ATP-binding protein, partial [Gaiellaceae bacterium]